MPKGKKFGGKDWKPGESGNPKGPNVLPKDIRDAREMNKAEFIRIANKYLNMTQAEIRAAVGDAATPAKELVVAGILAKAITHGDQKRLGFLLAYLIGKPPDHVKFEGEVPGALNHALVIRFIEDLNAIKKD